MGSIKVLVVIYNESLSNSRTICSLGEDKSIEVLIADNSTKDFSNKAFADKHAYRYFNMGGNKGLSKAYNTVISSLEKNDDIICLFDDDTVICSGYFNELRAAAEEYKDIDIFVPIVKDKKGILSPCIIKEAECKRADQVEEIPQHGLSAINSGLAVRLKVFKEYKYDEKQFLDYIDHAFIRDVAQNDKKKVHILENTILEQSFSGSEKSRPSDEKDRYNIFKKDFKYFCNKYDVSHLSMLKVLLKRRIRLLINQLH